MKLLFCFLAVLIFALHVSAQNYVQLSASQVKKNYAEILRAFEFGAIQVFKTAVFEKDLYTSTDLALTQFYSVFRRYLSSPSRVYYRFHAQVQNTDDVSLDATYTVRKNSDSNQLDVISYDYNLHYDSGIPSLSNHCNSIGSQPNLESSSTSTPASTPTSTPTSTSSDSDAGIIDSLILQGTTYIIQKNPDKIPADSYHITSVDKVTTSNSDNGDTIYEIDSEVANEDGSTHITMHLVFNDNGGVRDARLTTYSFSIQTSH